MACGKYTLARSIRLYYRVCTFFGVAPLHPMGRLQGLRSFSAIAHHVWSMLVLVYIYVANYLEMATIESSLITIEKALYYSEFLTNCLITTLLVLWCHYYAQYQQQVPRKLYEILKRSQQYCHKLPDGRIDGIFHKIHKEFIGFVVCATIFYGICLVTDFVYNNGRMPRFVISSGAYIMPSILVALNLGQYWLTLRFSSLVYGELNEILRENLKSPVGRCERREEQKLNGKLGNNWYRREYLEPPVGSAEVMAAIRSLYGELETVTGGFVAIYGLILLLNLMASFLNLCVQIFGLYKFFDRPHSEDVSLVTYRFLWVVLQIVKIFCVFLINNMIIKEKCRTNLILNDVSIYSHQMEHSVNRFLLQLMVRKQAGVACGIIVLDLSFIGGIINALAMYIIFLIQIDLGKQSMGGVTANKSSTTPLTPLKGSASV